MRTLLRAAVIAAVVVCAAPAHAERLGVEFAVTARPADPVVGPVRQCPYETGVSTRRSGAGVGEEGPVYVGVWVEHP